MSIRRDWGEGTFYFDRKRALFAFQIRFTDKDGKHRRKTITSRSKKRLKEKVTAWKQQRKQGETSASLMSVKQLTDIWLRTIQTSIKQNTYNQYQYGARYVVNQFGKQNLSDLKTVEIQLFLNRLYQKNGLSARTVNIIRNVFRNMAGFAVRNGFLTRNPLLQVKSIQEEPKTPPALDEDQLKRLLDVAKVGDYYPGNDVFALYLKREFYAAVRLAAYTGMRRGEVFGLDWDCVNLAEKQIQVRYTLSAARRRSSPKTKSSRRTILLDDQTVKILRNWQTFQKNYDAQYHGIYNNPQKLVFTTGRGTPVSLDNFRSRHWQAMCKAAGIPGFDFHGLRHTHATLLLKAGVNVKVVAERLGHADVAVTMRTYAHVLPTMQRAAVEAIEKIV